MCIPASAQESDAGTLPFDPDEWLQGPDRRDLEWKVKIIKPSLTLQQRYLLQVDARMKAGQWKKRGIVGDLHFVLKVADSEDNWMRGYSYTYLSVPAELQSYHYIQCVTGVYLRPGKYTIALIVYEANLKQVNIWRKKVEFKNPEGKLLPELDRDLPAVDFIDGTPEYVMDFDRAPSFMDSLWPLGAGMEWLPVGNRSEVCVDLVINVSYSQVLRGKSLQQWWLNYQMNASYVLQTGSVISHLGLSKGCVRVSIVDVLSMKTLFDRENAEGFDWQEAGRVVREQNRFTIDIDRLSRYTQASAYFNARLSEILEGGSCRSGEAATKRAVVVVSNQQVFPPETEIIEISPKSSEKPRFYYFCINDRAYISGDIQKMLKPAKPRSFLIRRPHDFRKALSDLILDLEKG